MAGIDHFQRLFAVEPEVVAHDLHPEYLSTKHAVERDGVRLVGVQHHHAHLAACLAEHGELRPAVGAIFDGTGYGEDGTVWGGELLFGDLEGFERAGLLFPVRMPGGEAAIRQPWRMACAWLAAAFDEPMLPPRQLGRQVEQRAWAQVSQLAVSGLSSPLTTSAGRLFDAVAALCGLRAEVNYEGQAAVELEAACDLGERRAYELPLLDDGGPLVMDARPMVRAVVARPRCRGRGREDRGTLPQRAGRGDGPRVRARRRAPDDGPGGALGRRVPEPAPARADRVAARRRRAAGAHAGAAPAERRRDRLRAARRGRRAVVAAEGGADVRA